MDKCTDKYSDKKYCDNCLMCLDTMDYVGLPVRHYVDVEYDELP